MEVIMTNIGTTNYSDIFRQSAPARDKKTPDTNGAEESAFGAVFLGFGVEGEIVGINDTSDNETSITDTAFGGVLLTEAQTPPEAAGAPARWTSDSLYTIDPDSIRGYSVNRRALQTVKEQLMSEGIDADSRTPSHEITDEQMEWLSSRYDIDFLSACSFSHPDFGNFMLDLAYLNVFSLDEAENMYGVMPFNANHKGYLCKMDTGDGFSGYVSPFGGAGNYLDDDELYTQLLMEYIKAKYTGHTDTEYSRMTEEFKSRRTERMMVIEDFFARAAGNLDSNTPGAMNGARPAVENIFEMLKEDFSGRA